MIELIKCAKAGFTLIEITIALLILAVGLVGILTLFPVGFDASGRAANTTVATLLAQEKIEDLKREGYGGTTVQAAIAATQADAFTGEFANYRYEIDANDGISGLPLREVIVKVFWPAGSNERMVELNTYIAKYEP